MGVSVRKLVEFAGGLAKLAGVGGTGLWLIGAGSVNWRRWIPSAPTDSVRWSHHNSLTDRHLKPRSRFQLLTIRAERGIMRRPVILMASIR